MFSTDKISDAKKYMSDTIAKMSYLSPHRARQADGYTESSSREYESNERSANPRNLFDDSNTTDKKWLSSARRYLAKGNRLQN